MKAVQFPIFASTFVLLLYIISVVTNMAFAIIFMLFTLGNVVMVWMVIRVLKDGTPSPHTFEEQWYEDKVR